MEFAPQREGEAAGIVLLQNHDFMLRFEYGIWPGNRSGELRLTERRAGEERVVASREWSGRKLYMKVEAELQIYRFLYAETAEQWEKLADNVDGTLLSSDVAGGFVGAYMGLYATSGGVNSGNYADFDWFEYRGSDE